ncbi:MAG: beta-ketoacyl-[acyl-carrier-protein] synthase family protein [Burkholderiales bacterium]
MKVCITGTGVVCPSGLTVASMMAALTSNLSAIVALPEAEEYGLTAMAGGTCPDEIDIPGIQPHLLRGLDRISIFSLSAAHQALLQAEKAGPLHRSSVPIIWGSGMGGLSTLDEGYLSVLLHRKRRIRPVTVPYAMPSAPAFHLAHHLNLRGPSFTLSAACASSALAIAQGARLISSGEAPMVVVGGCESMMSPIVRRAWQMAQAVCAVDDDSPAQSCRPFSARRSGFAMGEGAACLVLESAEHAAARNASVLGWLRGIGHTTDAMHISKPDAASQTLAMQQALHHAGVEPRDICYINAHGTATAVGDLSEGQAIEAVFAQENPKVPVSATKAMHGHLIGGAGALEAIVTLEAIRAGQLPGNPHSRELDPAFANVNVFQGPLPLPNDCKRIAMSNSFAFGGVNVALVLEGAR